MVLVSGWGFQLEEDTTQAKGVDRVMAKPFSFLDVEGSLRALFDPEGQRAGPRKPPVTLRRRTSARAAPHRSRATGVPSSGYLHGAARVTSTNPGLAVSRSRSSRP